MGILQEDVEGDIGSVPRCQTCGSERVARDAWACWNPESGLWELENVFDGAHCHQCEDATKLVWSRPETPPHQRIRELNDRFRHEGLGNGRVLLTSGIQERGGAFALAAVTAVRAFNDFSHNNDPWGEHDFGAVEIEGEKVFWKLDYYTPDLTAGSENPANEGLTHRVLTIMLASEY
ncbi:MAG: DUF3768 domain-containing protein [Ruegeria sp.]|uniref:DUF3768 domain-containing protein n=1 Tax=Ruegeria sp. TaxID=1879320 RepID=UPI00349E8D86